MIAMIFVEVGRCGNENICSCNVGGSKSVDGNDQYHGGLTWTKTWC